MNKRLAGFLTAENITQSELAEMLKVAKGSVSNILSGRNKPGFDFLESLSLHYPQLNIDWLITGRGKMYKESSAPQTEEIQPLFEAILEEKPLPVESAAIPSTESDNISNNDNQIVLQRTIEKILVFYSDGTFTEITA